MATQIIHNIPQASRSRRPTTKLEEDNYVQTLKKALSKVIDENDAVS